MPHQPPYEPFDERRADVAERLQQIRRRLHELSSGRAVDADDVDVAQRRATQAAMMSAAAHDRLSERYDAASITDPKNADAHRSAADAQRSASDVALRRAFGVAVPVRDDNQED
jgi:PHD/YefM family antitoxin component YafN of YafNO toxin-antitoxin module